MGALHNPAPGPEALGVGFLILFLAAGADMSPQAELVDQLAHLGIIITLVQAEVLGAFFERLLPVLLHFLWNALKGGSSEFHVVAVGPVDDQAHGHALRFGQQTALGSTLGAVGWIGPGFFPLPRAPWSLLHPSTSIST